MKSILLMKSFSNEFVRIGTLATNSGFPKQKCKIIERILASAKRNPIPKMDLGLDTALEPFWSSILSGEEKRQIEEKRPWQQLEFIPRADRSKLMLTKEGVIL